MYTSNVKLGMAIGEHLRTLPGEEMQKLRDSVTEGVERVVKPFLKRVEAQSHVRLPDSVKIKNNLNPAGVHSSITL